MKFIKKGKTSEAAALDFFLKQGWQLSAKNQQVAGVEIDLLFKNQESWLLVEVKSNNKWRTERPMSLYQKRRLKKAFSVFCARHDEPVFLKLAIVHKNRKVEVFDLEF